MTESDPNSSGPSRPISPTSWPPEPSAVQIPSPSKKMWLFDDSPVVDGAAIWKWWLIRLPIYNALLFVIGVSSIFLCVFVGSRAVPDGEDFIEPLAVVFGVPVYAFMANVCYMAGPTYDSWKFIGKPRLGTFIAGFVFASCLTAMPGAWAVVAYIYTLISGHKLE